MNVNTLDDTGVQNLVCGIVKLDVDDWRRARRRLKKRPNSLEAEGMVKDCERFFRSEYFENLTGMDGREFLEQLKKHEKEG